MPLNKVPDETITQITPIPQLLELARLTPCAVHSPPYHCSVWSGASRTSCALPS
ncbi:MAG TPA: hypothetical protein H9898_07485 [Candidatus Anaerobiospirillum stercoravium]|nr:hypothetical protein [Candidatus Anaerobiospirillum stercoravium]